MLSDMGMDYITQPMESNTKIEVLFRGRATDMPRPISPIRVRAQRRCAGLSTPPRRRARQRETDRLPIPVVFSVPREE